ncbi:MAG: hypothetical protein GF333_00425, partial [Candidatus Omnitrophica bacterium]|nr:hypothetical protein [Candidatus Omnitrophota bacterium]
MHMIALLTDFGLKDHYVGVMKGVIKKICPETPVVDVTHGITPQNILEAGMRLLQSYPFFPARTIFVVVVDPGVGSDRAAIAVETEQFVFFAPDNGVLAPVCERERVHAQVKLTRRQYFLSPVSATFHGRDVFAAAAAHHAQGVSLAQLGEPLKRIHRAAFPVPEVRGARLRGLVCAADRFGNILTNIDTALISEFLRGGKNFRAVCMGREISGWYRAYAEAPEQVPFLIIGSSG